MLAHSDISVILEIMPAHNISESLRGVSRTEDRLEEGVSGRLSNNSSRLSHSIILPQQFERRHSRC